MDHHGGHLSLTRVIVIGLALFGLIYLLLGAVGGEQTTQMSFWGARQPPGAAPAAAQGGLSGAAEQQGRGMGGELRPQGNPLGVSNTVMTQGYGVGSHAPAETWGAVDLAIDGNGDGSADPQGSWDQPVYATHNGVVKVTPNSWPAGNHIWVTNDQYRTGYAHLSGFAVESGQQVRRGDLIGYIGSTGMSSGPHLDYQVWEKQNGSWVNVNPLDFGALDGTTR